MMHRHLLKSLFKGWRKLDVFTFLGVLAYFVFVVPKGNTIGINGWEWAFFPALLLGSFLVGYSFSVIGKGERGTETFFLLAASGARISLPMIPISLLLKPNFFGLALLVFVLEIGLVAGGFSFESRSGCSDGPG